MALFKAPARPQDTPDVSGSQAEPVAEPGRGVRATWRYTVTSIVFFSVAVSIVDALLMLSDDESGMQFLDLVLLALCIVALAVLVRYCWFFRGGLGGGLPANRYQYDLLVPPAALWGLGLLQPQTLWIGAVPLWFAVNALAIVVSRTARWWLLAGGFAALALHGVLGILLGHSILGEETDIGMLFAVAIWALMTPLLFVASVWWWEIVVRLDDSRRTSGELAVAKERLRFAADLHDIQGHHLQVIALKTELAGRLLDADPQAARVQISEAQQLARTALEDTRALVHGYRTVSLAAEAGNASEVLCAAGIECTVDIAVDVGRLPVEARSLFGLVIREATTNILRHSEAASVSLRLTDGDDGYVLRVENDGVPGGGVVWPGAGSSRSGGSGIDGLRRRFDAVGGRVETRLEGERFVLLAATPTRGRSAALPAAEEPEAPGRAGAPAGDAAATRAGEPVGGTPRARS